MKKMLKITGIFLLLFVGNISMTIAQRYQSAMEGEIVVFDLRGAFTQTENGEIFRITVTHPLNWVQDITGSAGCVLLNVQREQEGRYVFTATWSNGFIERFYIDLIIYTPFLMMSSNVMNSDERELRERESSILIPEKILFDRRKLCRV